MAHSAASVVRKWVAPMLLDAGFRKDRREYRLEAPAGGLVLFETRPFPLRPDRYANFHADVYVAPQVYVDWDVCELPPPQRVVDRVHSGLWGKRLIPGAGTLNELPGLWAVAKDGDDTACGQELQDQAREVVLGEAQRMLDPDYMLAQLRMAPPANDFTMGRDLAEALLLSTGGDSPRLQQLLDRMRIDFPGSADHVRWIQRYATR